MRYFFKIRAIDFYATALIFSIFFLHAAYNPALAQGSASSTSRKFSEMNLKKFVEINKKVSAIEHVRENEMIEAIKAENLEVGRFNSLLRAQQSSTLNNTEATAGELAAFQSASKRVQQIQQNMSVEITILVEREMGVENYKSIMYAYQQNPAVKEKIDSIQPH